MTIIFTIGVRITKKKWSSPHNQQMNLKCSTWVQPQKKKKKKKRMISVPFQGKPFNITVIQVYALTTNAEEAKVDQIYEDLEDHLELTSNKDVLFIIGDWNAKVGSQESSRQV